MTGRTSIERDAVILACAISAGVHAALTPAHLAENAAMGTAFLIATALLVGLAAMLTWQESPLALVMTGIVLVGLIWGYVLAITSGLPVLHPDPEPVDGLAVATKAVEALGLALAIDLLRRGRAADASTHIQPKGAPS